MRPDLVEAVDVGGGQDLPAEALAPGRGRAVGVGPEEQGEQAGRGLRVGVAAGDRGLDGPEPGEAALQGPAGDRQGVARRQGEQDLQAPGGRLEGGAGRAQQPLAPARQQLLEGLGVGHVHRLEPVHHPAGVGLGLEGDVVHHPAQLLGQPGHAGEQALAGHLVAGQPEPQLVAGQVGRLLEVGHVLGDQQHLGRVGGRHGQLVLAEHGAGELADQGADLEAGDQAADPADHVADPGRPQPGPGAEGLGDPAGARLDQGREAAKDGLGPVGPVHRPGHQGHPWPGQAGHRVDPELGQAQAVVPGPRLARVGSGRRPRQLGHHAQVLGPGRGGHRHLPGQFPVDRPAGGRHQPGELPEQRDPPEEIGSAARPFGHALNATRGAAPSRPEPGTSG